MTTQIAGPIAGQAAASPPQPSSGPLERDARLMNSTHHEVAPGDIAIGVIIGRTGEFFDFFVYAIASVLVFPSLLFPYVDRLTGTTWSFAIFALAYVARPFGTWLFTTIDRHYGRSVKLTGALFLLGTSTMALAFLPGYASIGTASAVVLGLLRIGQGLALGGAWDGLPSLLALGVPAEKRGWYAMIPQLGAPLGLLVASGLFAFFTATLSIEDFLDWGWRYPFFVAFAINVVALFARLRIVATPEYAELFQTRALQPSRFRETVRTEWRTVVLGAFAPLASFALFHLVTVFPLSWITLFTPQQPTHFLVIEAAGAAVCVVSIAASGLIADRIGRRRLLGVSAGAIAAFSLAAPRLLDGGEGSVALFMLAGFVLLGLSFGQSSGAVTSNFAQRFRYTGAAVTSDLAWLIGAGFAPLAALLLASHVGLWSVGAYLLSGAVGTLAALHINREFARRPA
ncbi:MAG: MFS transporter [Janthinobacterium lividum]